MGNKDDFSEFQRFLKETRGDFHILEQRVPVEVQVEYFKHSNRLRSNPIALSVEDMAQLQADLHNLELDDTEKRRILSLLAASKQVKAYRVLEAYAKAPANDLSHWAYLALMESRISLETELSDEKQIYISTGLGGRDNKLRFFILLFNATRQPFLEYQREVIVREFEYALPKHNAEIERLDVHELHVEMLLLVPIRADIKIMMQSVIDECNQYGSFLSPVFTVTNVREIGPDEILKMIETHADNQASI